MSSQRSIDVRMGALRERWQDYRAQGSFEQFVEFTLALNCVTEHLNRLKLPGLLRQCEGLETAALMLFGDGSRHPAPAQDVAALDRQIEALFSSIEMAQRSTAPVERRAPNQPESEWAKPRLIWLVCDANHKWYHGLNQQLGFFGFRTSRFDWTQTMPEDQSPMVVLFLPTGSEYGANELELVRQVRAKHMASQLFCLGVAKTLEVMVELGRVGADVLIQAEQQTATALGRMLELIQTQEQDAFRVLVLEDSATAVAMIQRSLTQHGIDSKALNNPQQLLATVDQFRPDLVLMDMYMPHCTGVEAMRVLRQLPAYQALPVVYLSSETDMGMWIEALRLGGDQFLTKPVNPVFLAAVVKSKIERHREMLRQSQHDSLTGLLNHTASKNRLSQLLAAAQPGEQLCVAMIDIDHFKSVNDTYGHPVGDQVIRSLGWLLKGRLRAWDIIGRYGGEEFIVVLRNASLSHAHAVLDRIRSDFSALPHDHGSGVMRATFSGGLAAYPIYSTSNELTEAADNALLEAKRRGRNRIERAGVDLL
ncbi:MAG TPA: diguanylate cyclase [Burkholderiales bacterium]|nr:diguanylate cyclase [Burkholderiales bacterium]